MQITPFFIYFLSRLDTLEFLIFIPTVCIGIFLFVISVLGAIDEYSARDMEDVKKRTNYKWVVRFFIFGMLYIALVPDKKEVIAMYAIPKIVNSDIAQKDIPEIINLTIKDIKKLLESKE